MMTKIIGIGTILMVFASYAIGLIAVWGESSSSGVLYGVILLAGIPLIVYSYCAKCPARENHCAHYFPGKLAKTLPNRKQGEYKIHDYLGTMIPVFLFTFFPQLWLLKSGYLFIAFWLLTVTALILIRTRLCIVCNNNYCYICKNCSVLEQ